MLFNTKKCFFITTTILAFTFGKSQKYEDNQIINLLGQQFSDSENLIYFGNSIYKKDSSRILQLEIESLEKNIQRNFKYCFKIMTKIGHHANRSIDEIVIIMHVKDYDLPVIANSKFQCNIKFFVHKYISEKEWRSNCLIIKFL